jgi:hypothetical protein
MGREGFTLEQILSKDRENSPTNDFSLLNYLREITAFSLAQ